MATIGVCVFGAVTSVGALFYFAENKKCSNIQEGRKKRFSPQEIVEIHHLYAKYGNYAEVGRQMGRSGSTVSKYVKLDSTPKIVAHTFKENIKVN